MVEFRVGDTVILCASIRDFCGTIVNLYFIGDINISKSPTPCPITIWTPRCLDFSGILLEFQWTNSRATLTRNCSDTEKLKTLGSAYTDSQGKAAITYTLTQEDLNLYNSNPIFDLRVCIKNKAKEEVVNFGNIRDEFHPGDDIVIRQNLCIGLPPCSDICVGPDLYTQICNPDTGLCERGILIESNSPQCLEATHSISLSLGFVPPELMDLFDQYISDISNRIMGYLTPLPSPWIYIKTTYDRISNSFNILLHLPGVLSSNVESLSSLGWIEDRIADLTNWVKIIIEILLPIILGILAFVAFIAGAWHIAFILAAAAILVYWRITDLRTQITKAEEKVKNISTVNQEGNKEEEARKAAEDEWNKSNKAQADCIIRLEKHRDAHTAHIDGLTSNFSKYASLMIELKSEKEIFISAANFIIDEFKTKSFAVDVCNNYYVQIDDVIRNSNIKMTGLIDKYINPGEDYNPSCDGFGNKEDCEKAGCYWYDNKCHDKVECWIPGPLDTCILSANTGKTLLFAGGLLIGGFLLYKATK